MSVAGLAVGNKSVTLGTVGMGLGGAGRDDCR